MLFCQDEKKKKSHIIPNFAVTSINNPNCPPSPVLFAGWILTAHFPVRAHDLIIWLSSSMSLQTPYSL